MALGLIPVGSRNEGIDGIIRDGENGFLCEAGNVEELSAIIAQIRNMQHARLLSLSDSAKRTANDFSDFGVAKRYLDCLINH